MAKPIVHARSSARRFGGTPETYLPIHELMDLSKSAHATVKHRLVFHHKLGRSLIARVLGPIPAVDVPAVVTQHTVEDLGFEPTIDDYLEAAVNIEPWVTRPVTSVQRQCENSVARWGGTPEDYLRVHELMDLVRLEEAPADPVTGRAALHHAFGCFVVERALGTTLRLPGGRTVHVRDVAEQHVLFELRRIPDLTHWTELLKLEHWMAGSRKAAETCND
jgi:hypothetical protein